MKFLFHKTVQLQYCHPTVPIPQNGPVTVLSQYSSYTTKRSSYFILTIQYLYYHTFQIQYITYNTKVLLLYCHISVPIPQKVQLVYCHSKVPIPQNGPVTLLSQCSSYTTKRSSYFIVTVQFLYHKTVQLIYCNNTVPIIQNVPVRLHFLYHKTVL